MSFCHIQRKLIAFKPGLQFTEITIYSLIQLRHIARLMTKTGIISIHSHRETLDSLRKIIDVDEFSVSVLSVVLIKNVEY